MNTAKKSLWKSGFDSSNRPRFLCDMNEYYIEYYITVPVEKEMKRDEVLEKCIAIIKKGDKTF